jgi:hypothetical protein
MIKIKIVPYSGIKPTVFSPGTPWHWVIWFMWLKIYIFTFRGWLKYKHII